MCQKRSKYSCWLLISVEYKQWVDMSIYAWSYALIKYVCGPVVVGLCLKHKYTHLNKLRRYELYALEYPRYLISEQRLDSHIVYSLNLFHLGEIHLKPPNPAAQKHKTCVNQC